MEEVTQISTETGLEELLSEPYEEDVECARRLGGDLVVLGAGGKMGPTLVNRLLRARSRAGVDWKVYAASRFSDPIRRRHLDAAGASTLLTDLLEEGSLSRLPDCPNVIFMAGAKFGTWENPPGTWVTNTYLPGRVADRFKSSRIVAFSTGNVYPLVSVDSGGCTEEDPVGPVGEYAQSCLGRERILQYFSRKNSTPMTLLRLNYAVEARYGVLLDIASRVYARKPVSLEMGHFNAIWQGDANSACLRSLELCESPPKILNVTGSEILSVREVASAFAHEFGVGVDFTESESATALLNNAGLCKRLFHLPRFPLAKMVKLVAYWVKRGGVDWGRPTHFDVRDGKF